MPYRRPALSVARAVALAIAIGGGLAVLAALPAAADDWDDLPMPTAAPAPASGAADLADDPDALLAGRVLDGRTRKPIAGALVTVAGESPALTGADGRFRVPGGRSYGELRIRISAPGYRTRNVVERVEGVRERGRVVYVLRPPLRLKLPAMPGLRVPSASLTAAPAALVPETLVRVVDRTTLRGLPATFSDPARALAVFPGVGRLPFGLPFPVVRGSAPGEVPIRLEGLALPMRFHFGGLHSVVPPAVLGSVELHPDASAPFHGGTLGATVELRLREDLPARPALGLALDPLLASWVLELPLGTDAALVSTIRRSWIDLALATGGGPDVAATGLATVPRSTDYALLLLARPRPGDLARVLLLGAGDHAALGTNPALTARGVFFHHRGLFSYRATFPGGVVSTTVVSTGFSGTRLALGERLDVALASWDLAFRSEVVAPVERTVAVATGLDVSLVRLDWRGSADVGLVVPRAAGVILSVRARDELPAGAVWGELRWSPLDAVFIAPGVRVETSAASGDAHIDPRARVRWRPHPNLTLRASGGRATVPADPWESGLGFALAASAPGTVAGVELDPGLFDLPSERPHPPPARAIEAGVSAELRPVAVATIDLALFHRELSSLGAGDALDRALAGGVVPGFTVPELQRFLAGLTLFDGGARTGRGRATGVELQARFHPAGPFHVSLAYTLSRSVRWDGADAGAPRLPAPFHRPHRVALAADWEFAWGLRIAVRYRAAAGGRFARRGAWLADEDVWRAEPRGDPMPSFHSLDLRADWSVATPRGRYTFWLELIDAYDRRNPELPVYSADLRMRGLSAGLPLLPFGGVRADF